MDNYFLLTPKALELLRFVSMNAIGRPSLYDPDIAKEICIRLSQGESLRSICKEDRMPAVSTVCLWNLQDREGFAEHYARARQMQAEILIDEIVSISDESSKDYVIDDQGKKTVDQENINRSRLRVDTRKWFASKVLPKIYGDYQRTEISGELTIGLAESIANARKRLPKRTE